jgi:filamentous hemagglutinin
MYAYDASYFYYCFDNYDGSTVIWAQLASTGNIAGSAINNGNSSVSIPLDAGNVLITVNGISNVAVFSGAGANVRGFVSAAGNITANANITGSYFFGNGSQLSGLPATYSNSNVASYLTVYGGNVLASSIVATSQLTSDLIIANGNVGTANLNASANISATGNITGLYIIGNGSQLTGLPAQYGNSNVANYLPTYTGNVTAGNVITTGNVNGNSLYFTGNGVVVGNLQIQGNLLYNNVSVISTSNLYITLGNNQNTSAALDGAGINVGNNSLATFLFDNLTTSWQSNISLLPKSNALLTLGSTSNFWGNVYATGANIAGNITSTGALALTGAANVGSVTSTGNVSAGGNVLGGNILAAGVISAAGNIFGANIGVTVVSATSNVVAGNIRTAGQASVAGNITGSYFFGNGSQLTGLPVQYGNSNVAAYLPTYTGNISANIITPATVSATGNITASYYFGNGSQLTGLPVQYANSNVAAYLPTYTGNLTAGNISITGLITTANANIVGNTITGNASVVGNITGGNISAVGNVKSANLSVVGNVNASQISAVGIQTTGVAGNIYGANVITAITLSATGNVEAQYFTGNGISVVGDLSVVGNTTLNGLVTVAGGGGIQIGDSTITANTLIGGTATLGPGSVTSSKTMSATGNITGGNVLTGGIASATGNITGGNVLTGGIVSATGNIITSGNISAGGNIVGGGGGLLGNWNAGTLTVVAQGGAITWPTNNTSRSIYYRQLGSKQWEVWFNFQQTPAPSGGNSSTGDFLITLPNSLQFDTTQPFQAINTSAGTWSFLATSITAQGGVVFNTQASPTPGTNPYGPVISVYSATQFRIYYWQQSYYTSFWGNSGAPVWNQGTYISAKFTFTST